MPAPLAALAPAIIAGGAALAGTGLTAFGTGRMNRKSIQFSREMYERQQRDNLHNWNLQNTYNSPQAQMQRFMDAGLNPHLIYGQGNSGPAGQHDTPNPQTPQFRAPDFSSIGGAATSALNAYYDLDLKAATTDNVRAQLDVIRQEQALKEAQTAQTLASTERSRFDLGLETELRPISLDTRKEALRQTQTNIDLSMKDYALRAAQTSSSVSEAASRMLKMQEEMKTLRLGRSQTRLGMRAMEQDIERTKENINLLRQQGMLNDLDIQLKKDGIMPHDPLWARTVSRFLTYATKNIKLGQGPKQDSIQSLRPGNAGDKY